MITDDIVKLLLSGSFSFAIIGISYALIRFIFSCTAIVQEVKKPVSNIGLLSDLALEDYKNIRGIVKSISKIANGVSSYVENPLLLVKNMSGLFGRKSQS